MESGIGSTRMRAAIAVGAGDGDVQRQRARIDDEVVRGAAFSGEEHADDDVARTPNRCRTGDQPEGLVLQRPLDDVTRRPRAPGGLSTGPGWS